jgi:hypothetical protein
MAPIIKVISGKKYRLVRHLTGPGHEQRGVLASMEERKKTMKSVRTQAYKGGTGVFAEV